MRGLYADKHTLDTNYFVISRKYNTKYNYFLVQYTHGRANRLFYLARIGLIRCKGCYMLLVVIACGFAGWVLALPVLRVARAMGV